MTECSKFLSEEPMRVNFERVRQWLELQGEETRLDTVTAASLIYERYRPLLRRLAALSQGYRISYLGFDTEGRFTLGFELHAMTMFIVDVIVDERPHPEPDGAGAGGIFVVLKNGRERYFVARGRSGKIRAELLAVALSSAEALLSPAARPVVGREKAVAVGRTGEVRSKASGLTIRVRRDPRANCPEAACVDEAVAFHLALSDGERSGRPAFEPCAGVTRPQEHQAKLSVDLPRSEDAARLRDTLVRVLRDAAATCGVSLFTFELFGARRTWVETGGLVHQIVRRRIHGRGRGRAMIDPASLGHSSAWFGSGTLAGLGFPEMEGGSKALRGPAIVAARELGGPAGGDGAGRSSAADRIIDFGDRDRADYLRALEWQR